MLVSSASSKFWYAVAQGRTAVLLFLQIDTVRRLKSTVHLHFDSVLKTALTGSGVKASRLANFSVQSVQGLRGFGGCRAFRLSGHEVLRAVKPDHEVVEGLRAVLFTMSSYGGRGGMIEHSIQRW